MQRNNIGKFMVGLLVLTLISSCKKNEITLPDADVADGKAQLKLVYFSPSLLNPSVQLNVNGTRVSYLIPYGTPFPGGGYNTGGSNNSDYVAVTPGNSAVSLSIPKKGTSVDSVVVYNQSFDLQADKKYTLFTTDSVPTVSAFLAEDVLVRPDSGYASLRFVNLIPNLPAVDFYQNGVLIKGNVAFKTATTFDNISIANNPCQFTIKAAGGSTILATYPTSATFTLTNKRIYTIMARGYNGTTDARKPTVSLILHL